VSNHIIVCNDDTRIPLGQHKHKCDCGTTFFHNQSEEFMQTHLNHEEYHEAHACPSCGNDVRKRYFHTKEEEEACLLEVMRLQENPVELILAGLFGFLLEGQSKHSGELQQ
jgi:hypothetical protein